MNISHFAAPRVFAPLHGLWRWLSHGPVSHTTTPDSVRGGHHAFVASPLSTTGLTPPVLPSLASRRPLRVIRVLENDHVPANVGRMVISGRMADVCAELDRLADRETALH
jgi:hypothetical protein